MFKNVASQKLVVFAFDSTTNTPKTGDAVNLTAYVSKDYGAATVLGDTSATEIDATNAKGYYLFDLTQAETNADTLAFSAKSATANVVVIGVPAVVFTAPATGFLAPTTAGRTLDVASTGEAGLDFDNIKDATGAHTLTNIRVPSVTLADTLTTYTGNTVQTGDAYARLGAPAGASIAADIAEVEAETDDIAAVKAKTDNLPASPAAVGSAMTVDMTQAISGTQTNGTVGAALLGLEAQAVGKWTIVGTTLTLYRRDGTTVVRSFTLDSATAPTSRA
jgi:hypothetical protein